MSSLGGVDPYAWPVCQGECNWHRTGRNALESLFAVVWVWGGALDAEKKRIGLAFATRIHHLLAVPFETNSIVFYLSCSKQCCIFYRGRLMAPTIYGLCKSCASWSISETSRQNLEYPTLMNYLDIYLTYRIHPFGVRFMPFLEFAPCRTDIRVHVIA